MDTKTEDSFCNSSIGNYICVFNYCLLFSSFITLIFHCLALFKMLRFYRAIKFENLVILGGAIECIVLIVSTISFYDIFLQIGIAIQNLIELYIIRRLLRIIQRKKYSLAYPLYHYVFLTLSVINCVLLFSYIILNQFTNLYKLNNYILTIFAFYSHVISFAFLITGLYIKKIIHSSLKEEDNKGQVEVFYGTRMLQINTMIYSTLVCTGYIFIYTFIRYYVYDSKFQLESYKCIPLTDFAFWIHYFNLLANLFITMFNYISFYWLIRKQFINKKDLIEEKHKGRNTISLEEDTITIGSKEMNKFLMDDSIDLFEVNFGRGNGKESKDSSFDSSFSEDYGVVN